MQYEARDTERGLDVFTTGGELICSFHNMSDRTRERIAQLVVDALNLHDHRYMDTPCVVLQSENGRAERFHQDDYLSAMARVARLAYRSERDGVARIIGIKITEGGAG